MQGSVWDDVSWVILLGKADAVMVFLDAQKDFEEYNEEYLRKVVLSLMKVGCIVITKLDRAEPGDVERTKGLLKDAKSLARPTRRVRRDLLVPFLFTAQGWLIPGR